MKNLPWFLLSILVIIIDQVSKHWALLHLLPYQPIAVMPMVNLTLAFNTGAAFSFLHNSGGWHHWFFIIFGSVMCVVLAVWMWRQLPNAKIQLFALSLILGGAMGNLIDRLRMGYVIDFIQVYYQKYSWPIFNLADSAICLAAFILILYCWRSKQ